MRRAWERGWRTASLSDQGRLPLVVGGVILLLGLVLLLAGRIPFFGWLPGDLSIQRGKATFCPIVTCLLLSVVLTAVVHLVLLFWRR